MSHYRLRPSETFVAHLARLDVAGRKEFLNAVQQPFVLPSRQPSYALLMEAKVEEKRAAITAAAPDFAATLEKLRESRERWGILAVNEPTSPRPAATPRHLADVIAEQRGRKVEFSPAERDEAHRCAGPAGVDPSLDSPAEKQLRRTRPVGYVELLTNGRTRPFTAGALLDILI